MDQKSVCPYDILLNIGSPPGSHWNVNSFRAGNYVDFVHYYFPSVYNTKLGCPLILTSWVNKQPLSIFPTSSLFNSSNNHSLPVTLNQGQVPNSRTLFPNPAGYIHVHSSACSGPFHLCLLPDLHISVFIFRAAVFRYASCSLSKGEQQLRTQISTWALLAKLCIPVWGCICPAKGVPFSHFHKVPIRDNSGPVDSLCPCPRVVRIYTISGLVFFPLKAVSSSIAGVVLLKVVSFLRTVPGPQQGFKKCLLNDKINEWIITEAMERWIAFSRVTQPVTDRAGWGPPVRLESSPELPSTVEVLPNILSGSQTPQRDLS